MNINEVLVKKTKRDLFELARKVGLEGRSKLKEKDELIEALLKSRKTEVVAYLKLGWWPRHRNSVFGWSSVAGAVLAILGLFISWPSQTISPLSVDLKVKVEKQTSGVWTTSQASSGIQLKTGDQVQVSIFPHRDCHLYVFSYSSTSGRWSCLFPKRDDSLSSEVISNEAIVLPEPEKYFVLHGDPGVETIYVIASEDKEENLEALAIKYQSRNNPQEKQKSYIANRTLDYTKVASSQAEFSKSSDETSLIAELNAQATSPTIIFKEFYLIHEANDSQLEAGHVPD